MKLHSYDINKKYSTSVAYFSMEFAIDQALKIYSGGLGFLAGSHMRSAYDLKQNVVGIGLLWSFGYYDQERNEDRTLQPRYTRKFYYFLEELPVTVSVKVDGKEIFSSSLPIFCIVFRTLSGLRLIESIPSFTRYSATSG